MYYITITRGGKLIKAVFGLTFSEAINYPNSGGKTVNTYGAV